MSEHEYSDDPRSSALYIRLGITAFVALFISVIITSEFFIRALIAALPAAITALIAAIITYYAYDAISKGEVKKEDLLTGAKITGALAGTLAWIAFYHYLDKSSWIGTRCPACPVRGRVIKSQIGKEHIGVAYEKRGNETVRYNKYIIRNRHKCSSCGHSWHTEAESKER